MTILEVLQKIVTNDTIHKKDLILSCAKNKFGSISEIITTFDTEYAITNMIAAIIDYYIHPEAYTFNLEIYKYSEDSVRVKITQQGYEIYS